MFLGNYRKTGSGGAKEHLRDHSNYVETLEHLASSLNSRQAVHKRYIEQQATGGMYEVGQESEAAITSRHILRVDFRCLAVDSVVALWLYERFDFNESYFTIHPFFAPISYLAIFVD